MSFRFDKNNYDPGESRETNPYDEFRRHIGALGDKSGSVKSALDPQTEDNAASK